MQMVKIYSLIRYPNKLIFQLLIPVIPKNLSLIVLINQRYNYNLNKKAKVYTSINDSTKFILCLENMSKTN